jgi:hypothetical protein
MMQDITVWIRYYNQHRPTHLMAGYHPVNMKINGKRLCRCLDFVIHYNAPLEAGPENTPP